jgi:protein associated with RNAse G/E
VNPFAPRDCGAIPVNGLSRYSPGVAGELRVVYRKYDGSLHWHGTVRWLGEDEHGVWAGAAPPSTWRRGGEPPIAFEHAWVLLLPRNAWWTATFNDAPAPTEIYCDIATPAQWLNASEVTMVDLDLDVRRRRAGPVELLDAEEFADHQVKYSYPGHVIAEAQRAASWLQEALTSGSEPFTRVYRSYLRLLGAA